MKLSHLFTKTRKDAPKDEITKNAQLLTRAGYIHKEAAGVYQYLPLGLIVLRKIEQIVREEMNQAGGQELLLTTLQRQELWEQTDRWDDKKVDNWFKTSLKNETQMGLSITHEEPITAMIREHIKSYRDLPRYAYQFQTKFRNELRAKSGIMRGREFLMKDFYSFSRDQAEHDAFYESMKNVYEKVFSRLGIGNDTFLTFASGGIFTQFSHEFQTLTAAGEDIIYLHREKRIAVNQEVMSDEVLAQLGLKRDELEEVKAAEVGNIFSLGTRFSEPLGLKFADEDGTEKPVIMGSYGIGISRLMGVIVERFADERGLVWPKQLAPYDIHLIVLGGEDERRQAEKLYEELQASGKTVLYDDRDESAGAKFADADLLGMPIRLTISRKTLAEESAEMKVRTDEEARLVKLSELFAKL